MAYQQVSYGSRGSDVTELQKKLNENGYQLEVDGVFGSKTKSAVQDYQRKNSLDVDGIAGEKTWGSLNKVQDAGGEDAYVEAVQKLQQSQRGVPQYSASYDDQMNELFQKIMNREKFSYNPNSDAMYQQYRDLHMQQGQQAMQDTMGQAAGLTGGYGSSYSQNAGQQAYHAYLQRLNEVVPELYGEAAERYEREGDALYNQYAMLGDLRDTEYGRYQDEYDRYMQEQAFEYQKERDKISDEQWERQFAEQQRQHNASMAARYAALVDEDEGEKTGDGAEPKFATTPMKAQSYNQLGVNLESKWRNFGMNAALDLLETNIPNMTEEQFDYWAKMLEKWAELEG